MMEAERPKQQKKKTKSKAKVTPTLADIDVDTEFPSTSTSEQIPIQECFIASQLSELQVNSNESSELKDRLDHETEVHQQSQSCQSEDDQTVSSETLHASASDFDDPLQETERKPQEFSAFVGPSAPQIESTEIHDPAESFGPSAPLIEPVILPALYESHIVRTPLVTYPDLQHLQDNIKSTEETRVASSSKHCIQPFTISQLSELYSNAEVVGRALSFENEFIHVELHTDYKKHPLFELLTKYLKCRQALQINYMDVQTIRKDLDDTIPKMWRHERKTVKYQATCADSVVVHATENYEYVSIDEPVFDKVSNQLNELLNIVSYNCALNLYSSEIQKLRITQMVQEMVQRVPGINAHSPVVLQLELDEAQAGPMREIRDAISIFFYFLRKSPPDKIFPINLQEWLQKLVAVLLRSATWQDHLFLIFHVLRCPAGVSEWATSFIQIPKPREFEHSTTMTFASVELNHCVALLQVLLNPIGSRHEFLRKSTHSHRNTSMSSETPMDPVHEDLWILVDSDGDEDGSSDGKNNAGLKEKDLIAFLNQIPMKHLFSSITLAVLKNDRFTIDEDKISGHHLLQMIAFGTFFVKLLGDGLTTYDTDRYRQFVKMLSRLIRHTVTYVAELHKMFGRNSSAKDEYICQRILVEFDMFVMRAADYIYRSRCLGTWQYLAILPFGELSAATMWRLYFFLVAGGPEAIIDDMDMDFKERCNSSDFLIQFKDNIIDIPADDMYYLLQTFSSMALSRINNRDDEHFVERVTLHLFEIGFVIETTKELSYKVSRDLLTNLCTEYPRLISSLLVRLKTEFNIVGSSGAYLFKSLPLDRWRPNLDDFEIGATWLLNFGFETAESSLARTMFSRLNWNFKDGGSDLFLDHDLHIRMACLIVEVATKHVPETVGISGITESVRQVSNLVKGQSTAQQFTSWCWNMVTVLRLHCMDQSPEFRARILHYPAETMRIIPELERLSSIFQGVSDSRPMALYLSIMCTQYGHSVPQVCHKGFQQLLLLLQDYRQSVVIRCLYLLAPLFLQCPESFSACEQFQAILTQLLNADRTYMKMAKDIIANDYPGPVVELLGQMVQAQCMDYYNYGLTTPHPLIMLWLKSFTHMSGWSRDTNSVYLVNLLLGIAFQFAETWFHAKEYLRFLYMKSDDQKQSKTSFIPFLGGSQQIQPLPAVSSNTPWMSLVTLELEHEMLEIKPKLWTELLRQLHTSPAKTSMDSIIKKSAQTVGVVNQPTSNNLTIYKWANYILLCSPGQPLLPIICQRFFELYLARVPLTPDEERFAATNGVADKFYEHNTYLMKRLKKCLSDAEAHHKAESLRTEDDALASFHGHCMRLFVSFGLWLEETRLNQSTSRQYVEFPPQYDANRLAVIFSENTAYWTEFLHFPSIRDRHRDEANRWLKSVFRFKNTSSRPLSNVQREVADPRDTMLRLLESYDEPLSAPAITNESNIIPDIATNKILATLKKDLTNLDSTAREFNTTVQELNFIDCNYKDLVRVLYSNRERQCTRSLQCSSMLSSTSCKGARSVSIVVSDPIVDERIKNKLERNREKHELIVDRQMTPPSAQVVLNFVRIQHHVRQILRRHNNCAQTANVAEHAEVIAVGVSIFYAIIDAINEYLDLFPPSHELITEVLPQLGVLIRDNQSAEGMRLLQTALRKPHLVKMLSEIFMPSTTAPVYFLEMYKFVVESHMKKCDAKILFVLLSKFDVAKWLVTFMPKLSDISQLLKLILQGLECWNQNDVALVQGVLQCHLVHIFEYDFPEHYGEVLQAVLAGCSDQKLMPSVLNEILSSVYRMAHCIEPTNNTSDEAAVTAAITEFATTQTLFQFNMVGETLTMIARHFQTERLQHGLHGLYPKHKDYCNHISILLRSYGYSIVVTAVYAYPGLLSDKLLVWIWPAICDTFSPWLVPYYPQTMKQEPANWIRQVLANNDVMLPWSELYADQAKRMLSAFIDCILFLLETIPGSDAILGHIFYWYEVHYGKSCVSTPVRQPVHSALIRLPWDRFYPQPVQIECIHRILQQYLPECHTFMGHVFLRVPWKLWLQQNLQLWDPTMRHQMISSLLLIFVKLSFEPNVRENAQFITILDESSSFPWYSLNFAGVEGVFDSFILIAEPSMLLRLSAEHETVDTGILGILQIAASMHINSPLQLSDYQIHAKRILYVKTIVRMLRVCGSKYQKLLDTKNGVRAFHEAVIRLMDIVHSIAVPSETTESNVCDFMIEIVGSMQLPGEYTSKIFVEAIIMWQAQNEYTSKILRCTLNAIGTCKVLSHNVVALLESTLFYFFRHSASSPEHYSDTWSNALKRLGSPVPTIEGKDLVDRHNLLALHVYTIFKLKALSNNISEKLNLLQNLHLILQDYKTNDLTEPKMVALWGLMIVFGAQYLSQSANAKSLLLTLARFLQTISTSSEGWGDGVLGAIGLRRDVVSKRRRLTTRCLAIIVFSLFPDISDPEVPCKEYSFAIDELTHAINSKKYAELKSEGALAIDLALLRRSDHVKTREHIAELLRLFYKEATFLRSIEDIWQF